MKNPRIEASVRAAGLLVLLLYLAVVNVGFSSGVANAQTTGLSGAQVIVPGPPWPDSIAVPIQISLNDTLKALSIWLRPELDAVLFDGIIPTSFQPNIDQFENLPNGYWGPTTFLPAENALGFHWTSVLPAGLVAPASSELGTLYFRVIDPDIPFGTVLALDTLNIPSTAPSAVQVLANGTNTTMNAPFQWRFDNIVFGAAIECGDVNASGDVTITDAVFIVNYIFGGGPAPYHPGTGDVDCDGVFIITDAVYVINYLFGGGPIPCAVCGG